METEKNEKMFQIFNPEINSRVQAIRDNKAQTKFAHYTNADTALKIIDNKKLWLRQPYCMNDTSEIKHGLDLLQNKLKDLDHPIVNALDTIHPSLGADFTKKALPFVSNFRGGLYMFCISQYDESSDPFGKLSMWRAYAKKNGVSIIIKSEPFFLETNVLKTTLLPVSYEGIDSYFDKVAENIVLNKDFLKTLSADDLLIHLIFSLRFTVITAKHPIFKEEAEWRLIYDKTAFPSDLVDEEVVTIENVPQKIAISPLENIPEKGVVGIEPHEAIEKILIGPSEYPEVIKAAFVAKLMKFNIPKEIAEKMVVITNIPLRNS